MLWHADHVNFGRLLKLLERQLDLLHGAGSPDYELMLDIMLNDTYKKLPAVSGEFGRIIAPFGLSSTPGTDATLYWWMLPYIEQDQVYKIGYTIPQPAVQGLSTTSPVKTFLCPSDPSQSSGVFGTTSYAGNRMVFTVEPGIYLPGWGGVRIEDDVLVTTDGVDVLTDTPTDLIEI